MLHSNTASLASVTLCSLILIAGLVAWDGKWLIHNWWLRRYSSKTVTILFATEWVTASESTFTIRGIPALLTLRHYLWTCLLNLDHLTDRHLCLGENVRHLATTLCRELLLEWKLFADSAKILVIMMIQIWKWFRLNRSLTESCWGPSAWWLLPVEWCRCWGRLTSGSGSARRSFASSGVSLFCSRPFNSDLVATSSAVAGDSIDLTTFPESECF